jgi:hypothetical protein
MPIKMVEASCVAGVVSLEGIPVPAAEFFSEGVAQSDGIALMQGERVVYLNSNASDLKESIEQCVSILQSISAILLTITSGMTGSTTAPPPTFGADKTSLDLAITQLGLLKDLLK